ncbi:MAG: hypothetical protein AAF799_34245 [Myxococcota bacterium]
MPNSRSASLAFASALLLSSACLTTPANVSERCGTEDEVLFSGYTLNPGDTVSIQYSTSPTGPWTEITTATTSSNGVLFGGVDMYRFSVRAEVPGWASTASGYETYVRAHLASAGFTLITFDTAATSGTVSGIECVLDAVINNGDDVITAVGNCSSPDSPVVEMTAPASSTCPCPSGVVHVGDVSITAAADLDTYRCVEVIDGNLEVPANATFDVQLDQLAEVTGDLTLDYDWIGAGPTYVRTIDLPALATVGGDLGVHWDDIATANPTLGFGLDAITSVGGDITVDVHSVNYTMIGLGSLVTHPGNFSIIGSSGDVAGSSFASGLTTIGGDLLFEPGYGVFWMFQGLETVGGDMTLNGGFWGPSNSGFGALQSVGGDLTLFDSQQPPIGDLFDSLDTVSGTLTLDHTEVQEIVHLTPLSLSVGALVVQDNDVFTDFGLAVTVDPAGAITVVDNAALDTCDAETFVADQTAAGWAGVATISGNGGASCP